MITALLQELNRTALSFSALEILVKQFTLLVLGSALVVAVKSGLLTLVLNASIYLLVYLFAFLIRKTGEIGIEALRGFARKMKFGVSGEGRLDQ